MCDGHPEHDHGPRINDSVTENAAYAGQRVPTGTDHRDEYERVAFTDDGHPHDHAYPGHLTAENVNVVPGSAEDPEFHVTDESTVDDRLGAEATGETTTEQPVENPYTAEWMAQLFDMIEAAVKLAREAGLNATEGDDPNEWLALTEVMAELQVSGRNPLEMLLEHMMGHGVQVVSVDLKDLFG